MTVVIKANPTPDLPLLRKAVDFVRESAEMGSKAWNQAHWSNPIYDEQKNVCGTAYCVAGYVTSLQPEYAATVTPAVTLQDGRVCAGHLVETWNGLHFAPNQHADVARVRLGLTHDEAALLFSGENTADEVESYARLVAARVGEEL